MKKFALALTVSLLLLFLQASGYTITRGKIDNSEFMLVNSKQNNGKLLLLAHGYRPESAPLSADFPIEAEHYRTLLDEGWLIASSSYRRNGWIVDEAIDDLNALRKWIEDNGHARESVFLHGASMGGLIVTLMIEADSPSYTGAVAFGAAMEVKRDPTTGEDLAEQRRMPNHKPLRPIVFVSNVNELQSVQRYQQQALDINPQASVIVRSIQREGHVNVTSAEVLAATHLLAAWINSERPALTADATIETRKMTPVAEHIDGTIRFKVTSIHPEHGNLDTDLTATDLEQLNIHTGDRFSVSHNGESAVFTLATRYGAVPRGDWVAVILPEGRIRLARNFASAAGSWNITEPGSSLLARPLPQE